MITDSLESLGFASKYDPVKDQVTEKINTPLGTSGVLPWNYCNAMSIFMKPTPDKQHKIRFPLDCIPRNLVTYTYEIQLQRSKQIIDFVVCKPMRSKLDLADRYHIIRIHADSVQDATFGRHIRTSHSQVMQQGDYNISATMMRAIDSLLRNISNIMIGLNNVLIAYHTYEEHIILLD